MPSSCRSSNVPQEDVFKIVQVCRPTESFKSIACKDSASVNDCDAVAQLLRFAHDVRGKDYGSSIAAKVVNGLLNFQSIKYVEADGRFIEDDDTRVVRD